VNLSPVACRIFGVDTDTRISWSAMQEQLLNAEDAPRAAAAVTAAIEQRTAYRVEYRVRRPSD